MNTVIEERYDEWVPTDSHSFEYNLQSRNKRLDKPMKYEIKDSKYGGYRLYFKYIKCLIEIGDIILMKEENKKESWCYQNDDYFDYHGIESALNGNYGFQNCVSLSRIVVIQMK